MGRFLLLIRLAWQYLEHITRRYPKKKALFSKFVYIYNSYCPCSSPLLPRRDRSHYAALLSLWSWWLLAYSDPGLCFVQETWCRFNRSFMLILGFTWLFFFFSFCYLMSYSILIQTFVRDMTAMHRFFIPELVSHLKSRKPILQSHERAKIKLFFFPPTL